MMLLQLISGTKSAGKSSGLRWSRVMFAGSSGNIRITHSFAKIKFCFYLYVFLRNSCATIFSNVWFRKAILKLALKLIFPVVLPKALVFRMIKNFSEFDKFEKLNHIHIHGPGQPPGSISNPTKRVTLLVGY